MMTSLDNNNTNEARKGMYLSPYEESSNWKSVVSLRLCRNYRSHPGLITVSNSLFYNKCLIAVANPSETSSILRSWKVLENGSVPLLVSNVAGMEMRDIDSTTSWFNLAEVVEVVAIVQDLLGSVAKVQDIGIISPYIKQVRLLRSALRDKGLGAVRVGPTEAYQGQESRIIILSTVRSKTKWKEGLELLFDEKRYNVATTRAKALLVVVGNAQLLWQNSCWRSLLKFTYANGEWRGPVLTELEGDDVENDQSSDDLADSDEEDDLETLKFGSLGVGFGEYDYDYERSWQIEI